MPAQPACFHRLDEILSALRSMTSTHLDRAAVEKLFRVRRRLSHTPRRVIDARPRGAPPRAILKPEHKRLKEAVSVNPQWIGLPNSLSPGKVEASLYSGDSLDVLFSDSNRRIAVEVKGASAPVGEVIRGLFQCVKYEAVLDAEARVAGSRADCEAVLALGGSFPGELTPLRHTLGVRVFENLG